MIHNLTIGHLDTGAVDERRAGVLKPLDEAAVIRHLKDLGRRRGDQWTLDGMPVERMDGLIVCRWLVGPKTNHVAEEFAIRMIGDTGCQVIDREHCRVVDPGRLTGLAKLDSQRPLLAGARRILKAMGL